MATAEILFDDELNEVPTTDNALMAVEKAAIDTQISTAKKYPRSIKTFKQQAMEMATLDEETAASMFYCLPRGGKKIEGPSIRMAEVVGSCFGNLRYGARIVSTDERFITAQGACHDLEKNIAITYEIKRRITNRDGIRFNDDMIQVTGNAAQSIALREAIFRVVPRALFKAIYEEARLTSIGKATSMSEKRHKALEWFRKAGATDPQVFAFLEVDGIDDIDTDHLISLRGLVTAIKDGEITIEAALTPHGEADAGRKARTSPLNERLNKNGSATPRGTVSHVGPDKTEELAAETTPGGPPHSDDSELNQPLLDSLQDALEEAQKRDINGIEKRFTDKAQNDATRQAIGGMCLDKRKALANG